MKVQILTPEATLFDDSAEEIIVEGVDGRLGIMDHHAPLLASLRHGHIQIRKNKDWSKLETSAGTIEVQNNNVIVLLEG